MFQLILFFGINSEVIPVERIIIDIGFEFLYHLDLSLVQQNTLNVRCYKLDGGYRSGQLITVYFKEIIAI